MSSPTEGKCVQHNTRTEEVMDCPTCVKYTGDKPTLRVRL